MKPGIIYLYAGKIEEWTKDWQEEKHRESLWGRLLLIQGLQELGYDWLFPQNKDPEQLLEVLEASLGKGLYGKPYLTEYPEIHFNISHSGRWAVCALASMPCRVDIQERRPIRSRRMVERTMNAREQRQILEAEDSTAEFIKLWTYKESCIKLSGEGLHQDMKTLKAPVCHQFFWLEKDLAGCVAAEEAFQIEIHYSKEYRSSI